MSDVITFDPADERAGNAPIVVDGLNGYWLLGHEYPSPPVDTLFATGRDVEGGVPQDSQVGNRRVSFKLRVRQNTAALALAKLGDLASWVGRVAVDGGTVRRTVGGKSFTFDVLRVESYEPEFNDRLLRSGRVDLSLVLECAPYARLAPVTLTDRVETTNPELVFTESSIPGDVAALGRLVIDEDEGVDQQWVVVGVEQSGYQAATAATTSALAYAATALTPQGGAVTAAGASGAFGTLLNVVKIAATPSSPGSMLSGQLVGGGAYLSHVGTFRVFARVYRPTTNTKAQFIALEWGEGDFRRFSRNATVELPTVTAGTWEIVDLGLVSLSRASQGTQRWEPRVLTWSENPDNVLEINRLWFVPVTDGYAELAGNQTISAPTVFSARDDFNQTAGALNGKALTVGGTWTTYGDTDDLQVSGSSTVTRAVGSDTTGAGGTPGGFSGRIAYPSGATSMTSCAVQITFRREHLAAGNYPGANYMVIARRSASNTFAYVRLNYSNNGGPIFLFAGYFNAGVAGDLLAPIGPLPYDLLVTDLTVRFVALANGYCAYYYGVNADSLVLGAEGYSAALATGGPLASGAPGFADLGGAASDANVRRVYDKFAAWAPPADAAVFASQSLEHRHDRAIREDPAGVAWSDVSTFTGDRLLIPCTGRENRPVRIFVKASRNRPGEGADAGIDNLSARLTVTPRTLVVPE
ncbi:hypothetical protein [Paraconexibacter algicola]|uniref:Uncharacterized protein n=1 Tax=Paraconexibacter algicola TaxID=2133960 RepID=A0A2T4UE21_9ACTN|nr:hypothetical protein [Paraconexibacter algicola]PTL55757.1 hypothetical protein C7Y72_19200 [Paraconexibacter algicola]